jgi:hypothetical protein
LPRWRGRHQVRCRSRGAALRAVLPSRSLLRHRFCHLQRVRQRGALCSQAARRASGDRRLTHAAASCLASHATPARPGLGQAGTACGLSAAPWASGQASCHSSNLIYTIVGGRLIPTSSDWSPQIQAGSLLCPSVASARERLRLVCPNAFEPRNVAGLLLTRLCALPWTARCRVDSATGHRFSRRSALISEASSFPTGSALAG